MYIDIVDGYIVIFVVAMLSFAVGTVVGFMAKGA